MIFLLITKSQKLFFFSFCFYGKATTTFLEDHLPNCRTRVSLNILSFIFCPYLLPIFLPPIFFNSVSADSPATSQLSNPAFVYTIAISDDGRVIAAGLGDGSVKILKAQAVDTGKKGRKAVASASGSWKEGSWRVPWMCGCPNVIMVYLGSVGGFHLLSQSNYRLIVLQPNFLQLLY